MSVSLYDAFNRHQVYLEQVKLGAGTFFDSTAVAMETALARELARMRVVGMGDLTKMQLLQLTARLNRQQGALLDTYAGFMADYFKRFMNADMTLTRGIMKALANISPDAAKLRSAVWGKTKSAVIPATGDNLTKLLQQFTNDAQNRILRLVRQAYANKQTVDDLKQAVAKDMDNIKRNADTMARTGLQHVSNSAQDAIAALYVDKYLYSAVLDERTTIICQDLNGQVFTYGQGPEPPQHMNCRSKTIPYMDGMPTNGDLSFDDWFAAQSKEFRNDAGSGRTAKGGYKPGSFLTLDAYKDKLPNILTE